MSRLLSALVLALAAGVLMIQPAAAQEQPVIDEGALHAQYGARMPVLLDLRPLDPGDRWQVKVRSHDLQVSHDECHGPGMATWHLVPDEAFEPLDYHDHFTHELFASPDCLFGRYVFVLYWMVPSGTNQIQIHSTESDAWEIHPYAARALSADATVDDNDVEEGTSVNLSSTFDGVAKLYILDDHDHELWLGNRATPGNSTREGTLPAGASNLVAMTSHDGELLIADNTGDELWLGNRLTPGSSSEIGDFPSGLTLPVAMTSHDGELLIADNTGDELWLGNRLTPGSSSEIGDFPSGLTSPFAMTSHDGELLIADNTGDELWLGNRLTPGSSSEIGNFPSGLTSPLGMTSHDGELLIADNTGDELWLGNRPTPGSSMLLGSFPGTLTAPTGMASFIPTATYSWTSDSGGVFGSQTSASTTWTLADVSTDTTATLTVAVTADSETVSASVQVTVRNANEPPGVPASLSVSSTAVDSITASWTAPTDGGDVATYELRYGKTAEATRLTITGLTGLSRTISSLDPNTRYDFEVRARNADGVSSYTDPPTIGTTLSNPPGVPRSLDVAPASHSSVTATWAAPLLGGIVATYELRYGVASESGRDDITGIAGTSRTVTGLSPATEYEFQVRARNTGGVSTFSGSRTVATLAAPAVSGTGAEGVTEFTNRGGRMLTTGLAGWVLLSIVMAGGLGWGMKNNYPLVGVAAGLLLPMAAAMVIEDSPQTILAIVIVMVVEGASLGLIALAVRR